MPNGEPKDPTVIHLLADVENRIRNLGSPDLSVINSPEYLAEQATLERLYKRVWRWHGTGKFQYRDGKVRDVLVEIAENNGLRPHKDEWDPKTGPTESISTSPSRMYAILYATLHSAEGHQLRNPVGTSQDWLNYFFVTSLIALQTEHNLHHALFSDEGRKEIGNLLKYDQLVGSWISKVTRKPLSLPDAFVTGSDISGNYPILIGIREGAFEEQETSGFIRVNERRASSLIKLEDFTHIEVPEASVEETRGFLERAGIVELPVIPIEWGNEVSRTLPVEVLIKGNLAG